MRLTRQHPLPVFFALAYGLSWLVFIPMVAFRGPMQWTILATFGPCIAGLLTHYTQHKNLRAFRLIGSARQIVAAACLGIALTVTAYVVVPAVTAADASKLNWSILISPHVYDHSTVLAGPLGEEFGWRGYALPRLEARFGPAFGCAILGALWAGWHIPLFFMPGWTSSPFWIYLLIVTSFSFLIGFAANLARFAVLPAILTHAAFNTVSRFLNGMFQQVQPSSTLPFELVMALSGLGVACVLIAGTKGQLGFNGRDLMSESNW
jgi:uncharacterized protein